MSWQVRASKPGMTTTYLCGTARIALDHVRHFARKDYRTLDIVAPDGTRVTCEELEDLVSLAVAGNPDGVPVAAVLL